MGLLEGGSAVGFPPVSILWPHSGWQLSWLYRFPPRLWHSAGVCYDWLAPGWSRTSLSAGSASILAWRRPHCTPAGPRGHHVPALRREGGPVEHRYHRVPVPDREGALPGEAPAEGVARSALQPPLAGVPWPPSSPPCSRFRAEAGVSTGSGAYLCVSTCVSEPSFVASLLPIPGLA